MQIDEARGFVNLRFWGAFTAVKYGGPHIRPGGSVTLTNGAAGLRPHNDWTVVAERLRGDGSTHEGACGGTRADPGERSLPRRGQDGALQGRHGPARSPRQCIARDIGEKLPRRSHSAKAPTTSPRLLPLPDAGRLQHNGPGDRLLMAAPCWS